MADLITVLDTIYTDLQIVVADSMSVSNPEAHVGVLNRTTDSQTPFLGFEYSRRPIERGMNGNVRVIETNPNTTDITVTTAGDWRLSVDVGVVTDGDKPQTRDSYLSGVTQQFQQYVRHPHRFHSDVHDVSFGGTVSDTIGRDTDSGLRQTIEIEYSTYSDDTVPMATNVNLDVDAVFYSEEVDMYENTI
jgi:hypothetical protein